MTPVRASQVDHCPEEGKFGDCHVACLASLLDLTLDQVPVLFDSAPARVCWARVDNWLAQYDLCSVDHIFPGNLPLEEVLGFLGHTNPDVYYILGVRCDEHCHSVVGCGSDVVHDPTFEVDVSVYSPMDEHGWWVTYLVPIGLKSRSVDAQSN